MVIKFKHGLSNSSSQALVQRRPSCTTQKRRAHICDGVGALTTAPRKEQVNEREPAGTDGQSGRIAVREVMETEFARSERDASLVHHELCPNRPLVNGMLKAAAQKE